MANFSRYTRRVAEGGTLALGFEPLGTYSQPDRLCLSLCHHSSQKWEGNPQKGEGKKQT